MTWRTRLRQWREHLRIDPQAAAGASRGVRVAGAALLVLLAIAYGVPDVTLERSLGVLAGTALTLLVAAALLLLTALLRRGTLATWWGLLLILAALAVPMTLSGVAPVGVLLMYAWIVLGAGLLGAGLALVRARGWGWPAGVTTVLGAVALAALAAGLAVPGWERGSTRDAAANIPLPALPDPGRPGAYLVRALTYGSGRDRHRSEFAEGAALETKPVDGSRLIDGWDGAAGWARTRYWGFDAHALPLQGRVWYPAGDGPFPLVLIVHGNHDMEDFSDTGYAYLGRHLASRGYIAVSVDENFLNGSGIDMLAGFRGGLDGENGARGWLLLEHLRQFRTWNAVPGNPFHRRVDLSRVALIGHSRGGEAVAEAALFNRLPAWPDDARVRFDYGFGIRSVIAIAPADGQYDPRDRSTRLDDVSYLTIQGSHDGDVQSFMGSSQYARVAFPHCRTCFKASVYVVGANHGQFNTRWGRNDIGLPWGTLLNLTPIMDPEPQRAIATSLFTAFLEATLRDQHAYEALFAAAPRRAPFIRDTVELVTDYRSGGSTPIADYEEDADVGTATATGVQITSSRLTQWKETELTLKWNARDSAVALLAWDRAPRTAAPEYAWRFTAPPSLVAELSLSLAMADDDPAREADDAAPKDGGKPADTTAWTPPATLDASVVLTDVHGRSASVPLSAIAPLRAPVDVVTRKLPLLDRTATHEAIFQRYTFPIARFRGVDAGALASITLRFDRSAAGAIYVDDVDLRMDTNTYTATTATTAAVSRNGSAGTNR